MGISKSQCEERSRSWRPAALRTALVVISISFCWLAGELFVRNLYEGKYAQRPFFFKSDSNLGWAPNEDLDHTFYGSDFQMSIKTDADGYRIGSLDDWRQAEDLIVVSGDSYTFGWGVSNEETLVDELDRLINENDGERRVVNLGVGGYGTSQSAIRLREFWREHGDKVSVVFFLHSHNDYAENVHFASIQSGRRKYRERSPNGSASHLYNFLSRAVENVLRSLTSIENDEIRPSPDILFNVETIKVELEPGEIEVGSLRVNSSQLFDERQHQSLTQERKSLTALQSELMKLSLAEIHTRAEGGAAVVMHAVIHSSPDWYVDEVEEFVNMERITRPQQAIEFVGRVPARDEFQGQLENSHSGSHFTPELNAFYAQFMNQALGSFSLE